mmetsp:Transcript_25552/g.54962  ORF Transcript_25552/g.54962 Transcript_25552/m.54962 type:complete len:357 (-) Transcript_25552:130-1200(-)
MSRHALQSNREPGLRLRIPTPCTELFVSFLMRARFAFCFLVAPPRLVCLEGGLPRGLGASFSSVAAAGEKAAVVMAADSSFFGRAPPLSGSGQLFPTATSPHISTLTFLPVGVPSPSALHSEAGPFKGSKIAGLFRDRCTLPLLAYVSSCSPPSLRGVGTLSPSSSRLGVEAPEPIGLDSCDDSAAAAAADGVEGSAFTSPSSILTGDLFVRPPPLNGLAISSSSDAKLSSTLSPDLTSSAFGPCTDDVDTSASTASISILKVTPPPFKGSAASSSLSSSTLPSSTSSSSFVSNTSFKYSLSCSSHLSSCSLAVAWAKSPMAAMAAKSSSSSAISAVAAAAVAVKAAAGVAVSIII